MTNTNCLSGIKCPKCGNESDFRIEASIICKVTDDGSEPSGDHNWDDGTYCYCPACEFEGKVGDFSVPDPIIGPPSLTTLLWDFIENGRSSYGLSFFDLRERVRMEHDAEEKMSVLTKKLQAYCREHGLPDESADELLSRLYEEEPRREPQIAWLKAFCEEWERASGSRRSGSEAA